MMAFCRLISRGFLSNAVSSSPAAPAIGTINAGRLSVRVGLSDRLHDVALDLSPRCSAHHRRRNSPARVRLGLRSQHHRLSRSSTYTAEARLSRLPKNRLTPDLAALNRLNMSTSAGPYTAAGRMMVHGRGVPSCLDR